MEYISYIVGCFLIVLLAVGFAILVITMNTSNSFACSWLYSHLMDRKNGRVYDELMKVDPSKFIRWNMDTREIVPDVDDDMFFYGVFDNKVIAIFDNSGCIFVDNVTEPLMDRLCEEKHLTRD